MNAPHVRPWLSVLGLVFAMTSSSAQQAVVDGRKPDAARTAVILLRPVTVHLDRVPFESALQAIARSAGVQVQYRASVLRSVPASVSVHADKRPLGEVLEQVLSGTPLRAIPFDGDVMTIAPAGTSNVAIQGVIRGTVTDAKTKQPLRGAKVTLDGVDRAETQGDGSFRLSGVASGQHTMTVRLLGYARASRTVNVRDEEATAVDVALQLSAIPLDQVVVTGTIIPTELKAVPNAITVITAKQIEERGITHIDQLFRGDVPGLFAMNQGTRSLDGQVVMFSRGATALDVSSVGGEGYNSANALTNPIKTYVDGVELADPRYLAQIDPRSIERIEILTGSQASTIYGSNAINGVMQIFTKRGTTNTPQLTLNLLNGWVENNFSSAHTPQHDYSAQMNGIEGRFSYSAGGSWNYMGRWSPSSQFSQVTEFGGTRFELPTRAGRVSGDVSLRRTLTQNRMRGNPNQGWTSFAESGWYRPDASSYNGLVTPTTTTVVGQTSGFSLSYVPTSWWSQEIGIGSDGSDSEYHSTARGYRSISDSSLSLSQSHTDRRSLRYATTARIPVSRLAQLTLAVGGDRWQSLSSTIFTSAQTLTGAVTSSGSIWRQPSHSAGGFLQTQLGIQDALFLTYGLRAEWNPDYGADAQPNLAPRVGAALTHDLGSITMKLRASYGKSTRPPARGLTTGQTIAEAFGSSWTDYAQNILPYYGGMFDYRRPNPDLLPESQQGGEGGLELYLGTRGSLVVTRYNQTVDHLILYSIADSVRTIIPCDTVGSACITDVLDAQGYGYERQYENLNLGSIRNQGWELQGSLNTGPFTTRGTYSWTKSRVIGLDPKYRAFFPVSAYPQYQPGAPFIYFPEHTWAFGVTYAQGNSSLGVNVTGTGQVTNSRDAFFVKNFGARLPQNNLRFSSINGYVSFNAPYALASINATHRFARRLEGVLNVENLADTYINDYSSTYATMGRQVKAGFHIRTP